MPAAALPVPKRRWSPLFTNIVRNGMLSNMSDQALRLLLVVDSYTHSDWTCSIGDRAIMKIGRIGCGSLQKARQELISLKLISYEPPKGTIPTRYKIHLEAVSASVTPIVTLDDQPSVTENQPSVTKPESLRNYTSEKPPSSVTGGIDSKNAINDDTEKDYSKKMVFSLAPSNKESNKESTTTKDANASKSVDDAFLNSSFGEDQEKTDLIKKLTEAGCGQLGALRKLTADQLKQVWWTYSKRAMNLKDPLTNPGGYIGSILNGSIGWEKSDPIAARQAELASAESVKQRKLTDRRDKINTIISQQHKVYLSKQTQIDRYAELLTTEKQIEFVDKAVVEDLKSLGIKPEEIDYRIWPEFKSEWPDFSAWFWKLTASQHSRLMPAQKIKMRETINFIEARKTAAM